MYGVTTPAWRSLAKFSESGHSFEEGVGGVFAFDFNAGRSQPPRATFRKFGFTLRNKGHVWLPNRAFIVCRLVTYLPYAFESLPTLCSFFSASPQEAATLLCQAIGQSARTATKRGALPFRYSVSPTPPRLTRKRPLLT